MKKIQKFLEIQAFGVCTSLGEKLEMPIGSIRLFFIYATFLTFGSPIIVYLILAWAMSVRKRLKRRHDILWYS